MHFLIKNSQTVLWKAPGEIISSSLREKSVFIILPKRWGNSFTPPGCPWWDRIPGIWAWRDCRFQKALLGAPWSPGRLQSTAWHSHFQPRHSEVAETERTQSIFEVSSPGVCQDSRPLAGAGRAPEGMKLCFPVPGGSSHCSEAAVCPAHWSRDLKASPFPCCPTADTQLHLNGTVCLTYIFNKEEQVF